MKILQLFNLWWLPVLSGIIWWSMLIVLMSLWASEGFPQYNLDAKPDQHILYISDIAAGKFQIVFIVGSALQGILFILSGASELYLRYTGRLRRHYHTWALWSTNMALLFSVVGQLGILFVAIFDTRRYPDTHMSMLVVYIVFIGISALFNVGAYYSLGRSYMTHRVQIGLWLKVAWFIVECMLAIAFVSSQAKCANIPAVLEWLISFFYPFYQLIIAYDIWPAAGKKQGHYPKRSQCSSNVDSATARDAAAKDIVIDYKQFYGLDFEMIGGFEGVYIRPDSTPEDNIHDYLPVHIS